MEVLKEESRPPVEPQFLSEIQASGVKVHIGLMNKTEHEGIVRDIGRYEINVEENGKIITILKREIASLSVPHPVLTAPQPETIKNSIEQQAGGSDSVFVRPNIQQEFLDKAIRENQSLTVFLMNGQRIKATIEAYDSFTILLRENGRQHLFYKHSITTINR